jgi:hypothetical protein
MPLQIKGMETCTEWNKIFSSPDEDIDIFTAVSSKDTLDRGSIELTPQIMALIHLQRQAGMNNYNYWPWVFFCNRF